MVTVSERAKNQLLILMENEGVSPETHKLRVGVIGGCAVGGFLCRW
jgi:Fe-S cluster assembly iron-binding protein IscA